MHCSLFVDNFLPYPLMKGPECHFLNFWQCSSSVFINVCLFFNPLLPPAGQSFHFSCKTSQCLLVGGLAQIFVPLRMNCNHFEPPFSASRSTIRSKHPFFKWVSFILRLFFFPLLHHKVCISMTCTSLSASTLQRASFFIHSFNTLCFYWLGLRKNMTWNAICQRMAHLVNVMLITL